MPSVDHKEDQGEDSIQWDNYSDAAISEQHAHALLDPASMSNHSRDGLDNLIADSDSNFQSC